MKPTRTPSAGPALRLRLLPAWLGYLLVCTLLLTGVSFARWCTGADGADTARVAAGCVTVQYDPAQTILALERDSVDNVKTREFAFHVTNPGSEVAIQYDLVVQLDEALPKGATLTLRRDGETTPLATLEPTGGTQWTIPNAGIFEAGTPRTDGYTLVFAGDFKQIDGDSARSLTLTVRATQID